jgi:hypothetical protein
MVVAIWLFAGLVSWVWAMYMSRNLLVVEEVDKLWLWLVCTMLAICCGPLLLPGMWALQKIVKRTLLMRYRKPEPPEPEDVSEDITNE